MSALNEDRLTRIEEKVDKLSDAIISIARAEEKIIQLGTLTDVLFKKVEGMNDKVAWVFISGMLTAVAGIIAYNMWG